MALRLSPVQSHSHGASIARPQLEVLDVYLPFLHGFLDAR